MNNVQPWFVRLDKLNPIKSTTNPYTEDVERYIQVELHAVETNEVSHTCIFESGETAKTLAFSEIEAELSKFAFEPVNDSQIQLTEYAIMGKIDIITNVKFKYEDEP